MNARLMLLFLFAYFAFFAWLLIAYRDKLLPLAASEHGVETDWLMDFNWYILFAAFIPTNILLFERGGPTEEIWYYQMPPPEGRKKYSKTQPMRFEEFAPTLEWMRAKKRVENEHAWRVPVSDILKYDANGQLLSCNLDRKNPHAKDEIEHLPPEQILARIRGRETDIQTALEEIEAILGEKVSA